MDHLHAKAASELHLRAGMNDDMFYERYSCVWLHIMRKVYGRLGRWRTAERTHDVLRTATR